MSKGIVVLITQMNGSDELVGIATARSTKPDITIVVPASYYTGLVGYADSPSVVIMPERFWAYMATRLAFVPFQIAVDKVFPGIMILGLMLP